MKSEGKKTPSPLRYLCGILAVWTVLIGFSKFAGEHAGDGSIRIPAAALLLIVIPAAVFVISRFGTLCACMRSRGSALRRGTALLGALTLSLSAFTLPAEAATVSGSLSDSNIGWSESELNAGSHPTDIENKPIGTATGKSVSSSWTADGTQITGTVMPAEYKTGGDCDPEAYHYSKEASSTLTITNRSAEKRLLTFSYTVPSAGTLTIDGAKQTKASSFSKTLDPNGTVLIKLTTSVTPASSEKSNPSGNAVSATLSNLSLTSLNHDISVKFAQTAHGSYTVKTGSTWLKVGETCTKPVSTTYTLSARADANYVFDGWYVNDRKVSVAAALTTAFSGDCTVEARFAEDPLFTVIQMSNTAADKSAYVEVNSSYYHSEKGSYHTNVGDTAANNSYEMHTRFPYSTWSASNGAIQSSASGTATGDSQSTMGYSQAVAALYSDIIRVKCKENCIITFDSSMNAQSVSISNPSETGAPYGIFLYYYTTASDRADAKTITTNGTAEFKGAKQANGSASTRVVVNKGQYLYLYAYAQTRKDKFTASAFQTDNYTYTAKISNFTVTPNITEHTFTTGNRDNTEAVLKYGSVKINGSAQGVSSGTYSYKAADNAILTLTPGDAPKGYTFIGWHNVTDKTYDYTHDTYPVTMTKDYEVYPIYVPAMTITAGTNGYENATYKYKDLDGNMVPREGQYVARGPIPSNGGNPDFYTSLKDAFAAKDTVFLLAEDTINGSLTIPRGKTLVIPDRFAAKGPDLQTGLPEQYDPSASISSYCKVTLNGNLTVDGKLVVNGMQSSTANGRAAGSIGYLSLSDGATVTVKSSGSLFGYGQIRGGSISAENGSTVRELMEISDRRSALVMKEIDAEKSKKRVFPISNFSIKTIESPVTYASGAKLYAQYSVMLEGNNQSTGAVLIFGSSGALFNLTQGSMTKSFDLAADKTVYRLNEGGKMSTGSFQLDVKFGVQGYGSMTITIKSQEYWMPLNAGFDLRTAGEMTVNSDFKFLPGASLRVEKGGTCTVESGAKLLFYRLNDYDTRKIGSGTYQKGYSLKAYPVNATDLPGGGYKHPKLDTVGSARLNVDGEMIVKGGLYVSNDPVSQSDQNFPRTEPVDGVNKTRLEINKADFTVYDNGYNVLTGTGSINMTTAQTNQTEVYEAMTAQSTNDPAWAPIKITPIKGLAENATADNPDNYQPLNKATTYYGVYRSGGFYTWTDKMPQIAKIVGGGNDGTIYRSLAAAVQHYTAGTGYIQMIADSTEPGFTVDKNVTLDLNGKTVKLAGTLTVAKGCTLSGMDSSVSKDYVTAPSGKIVGTVTGTVAPTYQTPTVKEEYDRYVAISVTENGTSTLSFHHFNISVSGYRFELATGDTPQCALFFIGKFQGDKAAKDYLKSLGFTLKDIDDKITNPRYEIPADTDIPPESDPGDSPVVLSDDGAYFFEAYLMHDINKENYRKQFSAIAQATFQNDETQNSETKKWSFQEAWQNALTDPGMDISQAEREILEKFLKDLNIPIPNPNP